ncbi:hypothetical protein CY34DRAFT_613687 [Suillus luteus UH-Slu-Lm8-n1]|uniref:Unplaced genomic scaffold CY34scaffold_566, whole genome shotgun sequence n=1 Tax=Suillus luteus UH-Slu-Lm8-n1 TaxID=930992 RepID=A0A0C9ZZ76_9AGAM|nr:hypothetical protein CY34DRAFT_613687 [Suillus luteus UH-Slu-Lm8-n1]
MSVAHPRLVMLYCYFLLMLLKTLFFDVRPRHPWTLLLYLPINYIAGGHPRLLVLLHSTSSIPKLPDVLQYSRTAPMEPVSSTLQQSAILA